ncbi:ATP-binding protein [Acidiplasma cupricumulans]|uniref:Uncharacterized protein n=1 Tax=Acidiplasma cupricumulans TaxID=312540 RepID=A0A0Q0VKS6_9ARCH|nr:DUF87 domain-containing protein [Acidiplasma cupricumulans]KQB34062.1 hypothetical protein AOG55_01530 [Acidiplasma cupricumulans]
MLITLGEEGGKIKLISKESDNDGILPYGSYITVEDEDKKFILRVEESAQINSFSVSPMLADMDIKPLLQDQKVRNIVLAVRIKEIPQREDGLSSYIKPMLFARRSNQEEIDYIMNNNKGIPVFLSAMYAYDSQIIKDENKNPILVNIPEKFFFYQTLITGATGSGKTAAMKYLSQYFVEKLDILNGPGAVLAINVKEDDFLYMDKPSKTEKTDIINEWEALGETAHGIDSFRIYYPGNNIPMSKKMDKNKAVSITIETKNLDPENLSGIIQNLSAKGAEQIIDIFRYWQANVMGKRGEGCKMSDFIRYLDDPEKKRVYRVLTANGDTYEYTLHAGTLNSLKNAFITASSFFDNPNARELNADDILERRKMSVIDLSQKNAIGFGAILLRDILNKIYEEKSNGKSDVPVLVIIDEVHEFYGNSKTYEALKTLDAIARKGRSLGISVIFASQNLEDIPSGISKVVNSKIFFKGYSERNRNKSINDEALGPGYAISQIYGLSFVKLIKFPLPLGGLYEK